MTADAPLAVARKVIEDLVHQFAIETENPPGLGTGGLGALESAFEYLGWADPHPTPERGCDEPGCGKHAHCGWPTEDGGYRRTCGEHSRL